MPLPFTPPSSYAALETPLASTKLNQLVNAILSLKSYVDLLYPVGSIYISTASTSPATLFGFGTWVAVQGRVLVGAGTSDAAYAAGATGGESIHTLSAAELPVVTVVQNAHNHLQDAHTHTETYFELEHAAIGTGFWTQNNGGVSHQEPDISSVAATNQAAAATNQAFGSGAAHNNMPPYLVVYIWTRTA